LLCSEATTALFVAYAFGLIFGEWGDVDKLSGCAWVRSETFSDLKREGGVSSWQKEMELQYRI
jgi:hypothetical protein